jgi:hypothetical protein
MSREPERKELRIFKNAWFQRFSRREKISDKTLKEAISQVQQGLIDADLGGNVLNIARPGQGKSGGYRTIIVLRKGELTFFVYGFAKSERENIDNAEVVAFKNPAKELLSLSDEQLRKLLNNGALTEV